MYFLNYVDRNAIAQARLNDLEDDLGMQGSEFNTAVSMYATLRPQPLNASWLTPSKVSLSATSSCRFRATCSSLASGLVFT